MGLSWSHTVWQHPWDEKMSGHSRSTHQLGIQAKSEQFSLNYKGNCKQIDQGAVRNPLGKHFRPKSNQGRIEKTVQADGGSIKRPDIGAVKLKMIVNNFFSSKRFNLLNKFL